MDAFERTKQNRLEECALQLKRASTRHELVKAQRRLHNVSNWLLTPLQLEYKRELLETSLERLREME